MRLLFDAATNIRNHFPNNLPQNSKKRTASQAGLTEDDDPSVVDEINDSIELADLLVPCDNNQIDPDEKKDQANENDKDDQQDDDDRMSGNDTEGDADNNGGDDDVDEKGSGYTKLQQLLENP